MARPSMPLPTNSSLISNNNTFPFSFSFHLLFSLILFLPTLVFSRRSHAQTEFVLFCFVLLVCNNNYSFIPPCGTAFLFLISRDYHYDFHNYGMEGTMPFPFFYFTFQQYYYFIHIHILPYFSKLKSSIYLSLFIPFPFIYFLKVSFLLIIKWISLHEPIRPT